MNGYVAFVEGVRHEVYADTTYAAQQAARALYTGRKKHPQVHVTLCELGGQPVVQVAT
jgi:hypothetical protein